MARSTQDEREFDIILFGATGFAGALVAEYYAGLENPPRWAMAGRNMEKLEKLREDLSKDFPAIAEVDLVVANSSDKASLEAMAARTRVVCSTVGPYTKYGTALVEACIANGTHYCDLTGEAQWVRAMIDAHHESAREAGVRIVTCCGFDSIPSDLGTLMLQDHALETHGRPCSQVKFFVAKMRGGFSGGTVASMLELLTQASQDRSILKVLGHPYSLNPEGERKGPDGSDQRWIRYDEDARAWTAPFLMAAINTKIVRRSNALLDYKYGKEFRYSEVTRTASGPSGMFAAVMMALGLGGFTMALMQEQTRALLEKFVLPAPGEGPSREMIDTGFFEIRLVGHVEGRTEPVRGKVRGERDPGYGATATMLGESAICLALDQERLESEGGLLTPASAMGMVLVERLRDAGMTFEVKS